MPRFFRPLVLATMLAVVGCSACASSNTALKAHTTAAQTLDDVAQEATGLVMADRQHALDVAVEQAKADGLDPIALRAAVERAAAAYDAGPTIPAVNALVAAKDAYVRAVLIDAGKDEPTWQNAKRLLRDFVDAYTNLRKALGEPKSWPALPPAIAALLSYAPQHGHAAGGVA